MSLLEGYRLIDLSPELRPGKESRRLEIRPFIYEGDNTIMHDVDMMSHVGVHVEAMRRSAAAGSVRGVSVRAGL